MATVERHSVNPIKNFTPSWFAAVMGTGILAMTSMFYSSYLPFLEYVARGLFYFNVALFGVLLVPCVMRWIFYRADALRDLNHPVIANFYPTLPVGMLVLASDFMVIGKNFQVGVWFWMIGSALTVVFGLLVPYIMFKGEHVTLDHINPAWFIPPVGLIVIPIAGSLVIGHFSGLANEWVIFVNYFGWGAGFFLYLALLAISMYRFILHRPLPNVLAPTVWINLGPIGAGTVALLNIVNHCCFIADKEPFFVIGFFFWGFGVWWVAMAIMLTIHYIRRLKLPYAMSWWAFTFPLGAYVAATHLVAQRFSIHLVDHFGFALYLLLFFMWAATLVNTVLHAAKGDLFRGG